MICLIWWKYITITFYERFYSSQFDRFGFVTGQMLHKFAFALGSVLPQNKRMKMMLGDPQVAKFFITWVYTQLQMKYTPFSESIVQFLLKCGRILVYSETLIKFFLDNKAKSIVKVLLRPKLTSLTYNGFVASLFLYIVLFLSSSIDSCLSSYWLPEHVVQRPLFQSNPVNFKTSHHFLRNCLRPQ